MQQDERVATADSSHLPVEAMGMHGRRCSFASSSESSLSSSESDASSDGVSSDSAASDELALGRRGKSTQQAKLRRLRRIFLSRPTQKKERNQQQRCSPRAGRASRTPPRRLTKRLAKPCSHSPTQRRSSTTSSDSSSASDEEAVKRGNDAAGALRPARPLQTAIDQHFQALSEQAKRHSAQRDSTNSQVQSMLERAVNELQFLKQQEERAMESQVKLIHESYTLRLEVFQQQYLAKVAEIEDEMYASIKQQQEQCDAAVLAAAKKLQEQTQLALLKELPTVSTSSLPHAVEEFAQDRFRSGACSTAASSARTAQNPSRSRGSRCTEELSPRLETSPVSKQRAKLHALEQKLAAFSPGSVDRVRSELSNPRRRWKPTNNAAMQSTAQGAEIRSAPATRGAGPEDWRPSPLSPLRQGPTYWKKGISLEARDGGAAQRTRPTDEAALAASSDGGQDPATWTRKRPSSLLSRRFLRPEEEAELRHLRTSIGLAKDWMHRNQTDRHE